MYDPQGENITEILVTGAARPEPVEGELEERLIGRLLFTEGTTYLGEITDALVGAESGTLKGVITERNQGRQELFMITAGLQWEDEHWQLLEEGHTLRTTIFPPSAIETVAPTEASDDWMVGQLATVKLLDRRGHVIVERGQRITPAIVEQASRAGVLHRLEVEFPVEGNK
jgi:hypothetical protein